MDFDRLNELSKQASKLERVLKDFHLGEGVRSVSLTRGDGLILHDFSIIFRDSVKQKLFLALSQELERLKEEIRVATLDREEE